LITELLKSSFIYLVGNILVKSVHLIALPLIVGQITVEEFGIYDYFLILTAIVNIVITLDITQASSRFYPNLECDADKAAYTSTAFVFIIFNLSLFFIVISLFSNKLSIIFFGIENKGGLLLAVGNMVTVTVLYFTQHQLKWEMNPRATVYVGIVNAVIFLVCISLFTYFSHLTVDNIFVSSISSGFVAILFSIKLSENSYHLNFDFSKLKLMLTFSSPLVLSGIGMYIAVYLDRLAIQYFLGSGQLGIYAFATRFALVSILILASVQSAITPLIYKNSDKIGTPAEIEEIFYLFVAVLILISGGAYLFSLEIVHIFGSFEYYGAKEIIPILVLASLFNGIYIFFPGLFINKKTKTISMITITSAVLNGAANYALIPYIGIKGAAYSTLLSSLFISVLFLRLGHKYYPIHFNWRKVIVAVIASFSVFYSLFIYVPDLSWSNFIIKTVVLLVVSIISLFYLSSKNIANLKRLLS